MEDVRAQRERDKFIEEKEGDDKFWNKREFIHIKKG